MSTNLNEGISQCYSTYIKNFGVLLVIMVTTDNSDIDPADLVASVIEIAYQAGKILLEYYSNEYEVEQKSDDTPVTIADVSASIFVVKALQQLTPAIPVISEESTITDFQLRRGWDYLWLVDPLDGTREFIDRTGEFTINIALVIRNQPVLGVVYAPVVGSCYYACKGHGAWKQDVTNHPIAIHVRSWQEGKVVVACGRSRCGTILKSLLAKLPDYSIITLGSALKSCVVAEGVADLYARFGPTSEWDTAAAQIILEEAGGALTDTKLQPLRYNTKIGLLNPHFVAFGNGLQLENYL